MLLTYIFTTIDKLLNNLMSTAVKNNINKRKLYLFSFSFNTQNYLNLTLKKRG